MMFVVTNRLPVTKGREAEFELKFKQRARLVEGSPGFIRSEIHRPLPMRRRSSGHGWEPDVDELGFYEVKTWWESFEHFTAWTSSEAFRVAHKQVLGAEGRPDAALTEPGLLRERGEIVFHEVFAASSDPT